MIFNFDTRDNKILPQKGIVWDSEIRGYYNFRDSGKSFVKLRSELSFFLSFRRDPRVVFAFRAGGAMNLGDYEFYYANFLGGKTNLRGFRNNRYAGDYSFYQNTEIRFKIMNINSYLLKGPFGVLLHNDVGRVWVVEEPSNSWHDGYGIGLWIAPYKFAALTLNYNMSNEDKLLTFTFNYLF
jgi:outer membrane protein assembly factor BamA